MSNVRVAAGAVLGSVTSAATTVSSLFDTGTKSVGMLNKFVSDAADKQSIRSTIDMHDFQEKLVEEKAMEETKRKTAIIEFCKDQQQADLYQKSYERLSSLFDKKTT